jgi:hypothetical protein
MLQAIERKDMRKQIFANLMKKYIYTISLPTIAEGEERPLQNTSTSRKAKVFRSTVHCTKNLIYVFPDMKLRNLVPRIGLPIWLQQYRQTDHGNI